MINIVMKPYFFTNFANIFDKHLPSNICEIGTFNGKTACQMIDYLITRVDKISYTGFDLFDDASDENHKLETNGKGKGNYSYAVKLLNKRVERYGDKFEYFLNRGYTKETLISPLIFDFVYIDGGHSYDTVKHDYNMVKESRIIVFDDYQIPGVKQLVKELEIELADSHNFEFWNFDERTKREQVLLINNINF